MIQRGRLEGWRKEAALHSRFQQTLSPHFTVLFEGPAEQRLASAALDALEAAYWRIGTTLLAYPSGILTVVLYTDEQFRDITRSPTWAGGVFDGKIRVPMRGALNDPRQLEKVLAHEFTHALIKSLAPRGVPTWVDEGLAVVFEMGDVKWAERLARRAPSLVPLPRLHDGFLSLPADQVPLAYAESALAVRMLIERGADVKAAGILPIANAYRARCAKCLETLMGQTDRATLTRAALQPGCPRLGPHSNGTERFCESP